LQRAAVVQEQSRERRQQLAPLPRRRWIIDLRGVEQLVEALKVGIDGGGKQFGLGVVVVEHAAAGDTDLGADFVEGARAEAAFTERGQRRLPDSEPGFLLRSVQRLVPSFRRRQQSLVRADRCWALGDESVSAHLLSRP
jgi:hypothetical protein